MKARDVKQVGLNFLERLMTNKSSSEFHLSISEDDQSVTAAQLLAQASGLSSTAVKQAMQKGAVWVSGSDGTRRLRRASKKLKSGDELHFYYNPQVLNERPEPPTLIADEGAYSIWNKPGGLLSQGSKWSDHCTVYRWAEQHLQPQRPAFLVHRLDRAASGLILLAHTKSMARQLVELFDQREIEKRYRVTVVGDMRELSSGHDDLSAGHNGGLMINEPLDGKAAVSHIQVTNFREDSNCTELLVDIETGRKHQIRRHLSGAGFPVLGDRLYGRVEPNDVMDLQLQAVRLAFRCPVSGESRCYSLC